MVDKLEQVRKLEQARNLEEKVKEIKPKGQRDTEFHDQIISNMASYRKMREEYAEVAFKIVRAYLGVLLLIFCLDMFFHLITSQVMITLLATTTVNVLGLAFISLRGMFGKFEYAILQEELKRKRT